MITDISGMPGDETLLWAARTFIYAQFAATGAPPTIEQSARQFGVSAAATAALYQELDARHAIVLERGSERIRMANPFSAVPTPFMVTAGASAIGPTVPGMRLGYQRRCTPMRT